MHALEAPPYFDDSLIVSLLRCIYSKKYIFIYLLKNIFNNIFKPIVWKGIHTVQLYS